MPDFLDKFYPKVDVFEKFQYDTSLPREEQAFAAWRNLLSAKQSYQALFLIIGRILKDVRDKELYKELDYATFGEFLGSEELDFSREKAYLCIRTYEYLIEHLGLAPGRIKDMKISRINQMMPLLKKIEEEEGKEAAIEQLEDFERLRHADFVREVQRQKKSSRPSVYYSEETKTWIVSYYEDVTTLKNVGSYEDLIGQETD